MPPISPNIYQDCTLCPRMCHADRTRKEGFCGCPPFPRAARAALHPWEEPCISGQAGSGTVFFSGCTLRCCFCQNFKLSHQAFGQEVSSEKLARIFLSLQRQGAGNINLVTPTQFLPHIMEAIDIARPGLSVPVVYNCGGYERAETIDALNGYIDIYLPDLKYMSPRLSSRYSQASDYFEIAAKAIPSMIRQVGPPVIDPDTRLLKKGVIIRHMVLPGAKDDSIRLLGWMKDALPEHGFMLSLMSQYTPFFHSSGYPEINRRITSYEYQKVVDEAIRLGLTWGFMQEKSSAKEEYTPPFNLEGLDV